MPPKILKTESAIHESAHYVVGYVLDCHHKFITIRDIPRCVPYQPKRRPILWRLVLCQTAGYIADTISGRYSIDEALDKLESNAKTGDADGLWRMLESCAYEVFEMDNPDSDEEDIDGKLMESWFIDALEQTEVILRNKTIWRAVISLSKELVKKGTIQRKEADSIVEKAFRNTRWMTKRTEMQNKYADIPHGWFLDDSFVPIALFRFVPMVVVRAALDRSQQPEEAYL
jgi:hypothetical protein